jgi:hypothetical protein
MPIQLTEDQWASVLGTAERPVRVTDPGCSNTYVLVQENVYERFKSLFEADPVTGQERLF